MQGQVDHYEGELIFDILVCRFVALQTSGTHIKSSSTHIKSSTVTAHEHAHTAAAHT